MIVRKTRPEEGRRVNELFAIAFEQPMENGPVGEDDSGMTHWAAFDDAGEMTSTFTITDFPFHFDGNVVKMGGIGGVATLPSHRRTGGIRAAFQAALPDMYENGYVFSYLYPFSTAYYRKFGYENCVCKRQVTVDLGLLSPRKVGGRCVLAERGKDLTKAVMELDGLWERTYNMTVRHTEKDYAWVAKADPTQKPEFLYVYFDDGGIPGGYTQFRLENQPDGRNLVASRFCFRDRTGFDGLMNLVKTMASDHRYFKFQLPEEEAMPYLFPEWSLGAAQWNTVPSGMVRVINVQKVLEMAAYRGSGTVRLGITDSQIEQNCGTFLVEFRNDTAVEVRKTDEAPDLELPIGAFSALISGVSGLEAALKWMPDVVQKRDDPALAGAFYKKPLWIGDYF